MNNVQNMLMKSRFIGAGAACRKPDPLQARCQGSDPSGNYLLQFGSTGLSSGFLYQPCGLAVDPAGNVWVADAGNNRIQQFSGAFNGPIGIAVDAANTGNVWVADSRNQRAVGISSGGT